MTDATNNDKATTYNEGVNGFHILTFVTDGYGNLIAEDAYGNHLGMVKYPKADTDFQNAANKALADALPGLALEAFETLSAHHRAGVTMEQVQLDRRADRVKLRAEVEARLANKAANQE